MKNKSFIKSFAQFTAGLSLLLAAVSGAFAQPDFSGLYMPSFGAGGGQTPRETPFNDFAQGLYDTYVEEFNVDDDPGGFCIKPGLLRSIWGAPFPVEIVQTEGFINMFWEGYFQYRKIYLEGHDRPEPILHSGMGYSVGHWEDDVLVIETSYLREYPYMRRLPNSNDATVVERMSLEERDGVQYLNNELTLTDSNLYTQPIIVRGTLASSPDTPVMEYSCSEGIYDQYLSERGLQIPDLNQ